MDEGSPVAGRRQPTFVWAKRACGLADSVSGGGATCASADVAVVIGENGLVQEVLAGQQAANRKVEAARSGYRVFEGDLLLPGFVDIHTHGLGGTDDAVDYWLNPGFTQDHLPKLGTTSFLASIVFTTAQRRDEVTARLVERIGKVGHGAVVEGIHAEGPCVHDLGALPKSEVPMSVEDLTKWIKSLPPNTLRMMTISPKDEAEINYARLKCLLDHSVLPALGHDRVASESDILGAMQCAKHRRLHITHLFNVTNFHHRLPSLVNFGISEKLPNLPGYTGLMSPTVEIIGDFAHVHPLTLQATLAARNPDNVAFISDAVALPDPGKRTTYVGRELEVASDGKSVKLAGTDTLAGSCASLLATFKNLVTVLGVAESDASKMLSATPARIVGLEDIGQVKVGCRADLLLLDDTYDLQHTIIGGKAVYSKDT